jgi:hypothetical protein
MLAKVVQDIRVPDEIVTRLITAIRADATSAEERRKEKVDLARQRLSLVRGLLPKIRIFLTTNL